MTPRIRVNGKSDAASSSREKIKKTPQQIDEQQSGGGPGGSTAPPGVLSQPWLTLSTSICPRESSRLCLVCPVFRISVHFWLASSGSEAESLFFFLLVSVVATAIQNTTYSVVAVDLFARRLVRALAFTLDNKANISTLVVHSGTSKSRNYLQ